MKIKSLRLNRFKQFENFSLTCREMNVLTGPNNAGKSSILDALRICKDVLRIAHRRVPVNASQPLLGVCATHLLDDSSISVSTDNIVRDYGSNNAEIIVRLENDNTLTVQMHPERKTQAFLHTADRQPRSATHFKAAFPLEIIVIPTLSPFESKEKWVTEETSKLNETTKLSSRSFRNIWLRKSDQELKDFNLLVRRAWPNVSLQKPRVVGPDRILEMHYYQDSNVQEVFSAGFGFQVWLQMMTHIMRGNSKTTLVLDEPDIYLHPDLQRKLIRILQESFGQTFLATHSTEIINEVNAGDVLSIESRMRTARRITSEHGYRQLFNYLGSSENVEFARMARARRIVFFEGDDRRLLRRFATKVVGSNLLEDPDTVFLKTGGFGQWKRVSEVGWTLETVFGMQIKISALFDRDYRCSEEVAEFQSQINSPTLLCHVLKRKEIENYCLHEDALLRTIAKRAEAGGTFVSDDESRTIIRSVLDELHHDVRANIVGDYLRFNQKRHRELNETTLISRGMTAFESAWSNENRRLELVGGKDFLSALSHQLQKRIGKSVTLAQIVQELRPSELDPDLVHIITTMEEFFAA